MIQRWLTLTIFAMVSTLAAQAARGSDYAVLISTGADNGGIHLGADFEFKRTKDLSVGAYARIFQKNEDDDNEEVQQEGVTAFGGFVRAHFKKGRWDLGVAPGFGFVSVDPGQIGLADDDSQFALGPVMIMDVLYRLNGYMSVGLEWLGIYTWFNSEVDHDLKDNLAVRLRFDF